MERVQKILEYVLSICNDLEEAIQIAQLVVIALLNRKCSRLEKQLTPTSSVSEPVVTESPIESVRAEARAKLLSDFNQDIDLVCSEKPVESFTEEENTRFNRIMNYMRSTK